MDLGSKMKLGSFVVMKKKEGKRLFMVVSTLRGEWQVRFRADNKLFKVFDSVDEETRNPVHTLIATMFAASHILDAGFTNDVVAAVGRYQKRVETGATGKDEEATEEESQRIIEEERRAYVMNEERLKMNEDGKEE